MSGVRKLNILRITTISFALCINALYGTPTLEDSLDAITPLANPRMKATVGNVVGAAMGGLFLTAPIIMVLPKPIGGVYPPLALAWMYPGAAVGAATGTTLALSKRREGEYDALMFTHKERRKMFALSLAPHLVAIAIGAAIVPIEGFGILGVLPFFAAWPLSVSWPVSYYSKLLERKQIEESAVEQSGAP